MMLETDVMNSHGVIVHASEIGQTVNAVLLDSVTLW
jgi:hypothetical protein